MHQSEVNQVSDELQCPPLLIASCADGEYFPGMVNLSGVLCYMNSVLQVSNRSGSLSSC